MNLKPWQQFRDVMKWSETLDSKFIMKSCFSRGKKSMSWRSEIRRHVASNCISFLTYRSIFWKFYNFTWVFAIPFFPKKQTRYIDKSISSKEPIKYIVSSVNATPNKSFSLILKIRVFIILESLYIAIWNVRKKSKICTICAILL